MTVSPLNPLDGYELIFPLTCQFRVIAEAREGMAFVIETVLMQLGVTAPLENGFDSAQGRYHSYHVTTVVHSREEMNRIDKELRLIEGVRMVL